MTRLEADFRASKFATFWVPTPEKGAFLERLDCELSDDQFRRPFFAVLRYPLGPTPKGAVFRRPKRRGRGHDSEGGHDKNRGCNSLVSP